MSGARRQSDPARGGSVRKIELPRIQKAALWLALGAFCVWLGASRAGADEEAAPAAPAPESAAPAAAAPLPAYFTTTSPDAAKPSWADQTGGAAGVWATPAGDGKGDAPSGLALTDVYDRVVHNLLSINMVWALVTGFLVMFMQAGFMFVETGLCRAKNAAHTSAMNFL